MPETQEKLCPLLGSKEPCWGNQCAWWHIGQRTVQQFGKPTRHERYEECSILTIATALAARTEG